MTRLKKGIFWAIALFIIMVMGVPWFLWGSSFLFLGIPVWVWYHVGWLFLVTIIFWIFVRTFWARSKTGNKR